MDCCLEVIYLYVGIESRDCNYLDDTYFFLNCIVLFSVFSGCCPVVVYLTCGMSFEVMYVYIGSGCRDRNYFHNY